MQVGSTVQSAPTIPPRRGLKALLAVAVLLATIVMVVAGLLMTRGEVIEDATYKAQAPRVALYENKGIAHQVDVRTRGVAQQAPWVTLYNEEKSNVHQQVIRVR